MYIYEIYNDIIFIFSLKSFIIFFCWESEKANKNIKMNNNDVILLKEKNMTHRWIGKHK